VIFLAVLMSVCVTLGEEEEKEDPGSEGAIKWDYGYPSAGCADNSKRAYDGL